MFTLQIFHLTAQDFLWSITNILNYGTEQFNFFLNKNIFVAKNAEIAFLSCTLFNLFVLNSKCKYFLYSFDLTIV